MPNPYFNPGYGSVASICVACGQPRRRPNPSCPSVRDPFPHPAPEEERA